MGAHWLVLRLIDEPTNPAYTADYLSSNVLPFSFKQRVEELWAQVNWYWIKWYVIALSTHVRIRGTSVFRLWWETKLLAYIFKELGYL